MLRLAIALHLVLLLTACQPAQLSPVAETVTPTDIPQVAETLPLAAADTATPLLADTPTPEATLIPYDDILTAAAPTRAALAKIEPVVLHVNGLVFSDTTLLPAEPYRLSHSDEEWQNTKVFLQMLPEEIQELHWNELYPGDPSGAEAQAVLAQFGYRLEQVDDIYWRLREDETLLTDKIRAAAIPFQVHLNQSGTDFWMLLFIDEPAGPSVWLLRKDSFALWYGNQPPHPNPVFVGDEFFTAQVGIDAQGDKQAVHIQRNGETVFTYSGPEFIVGNCPVETFRAWEDTWVLQIDDQIFVGGQSLREAGYARSFGWRPLGDKPYFLFQKDEDGLYGISYDGVELPLQYEEIAYWPCIDTMFTSVINPDGNAQIVTFFARQAGMWHYIEVVPE